MEQRISFITLGVEDLRKMKEFYVEKFGWKVLTENDNIVFFKMNGMILGLFEKEALAEDAGVASDGSGFKGITLAYNVRSEKEVDEVFQFLRSKGVEVVKEPMKVFWGGYSGYVSDPEGNLWEVACNPYLELDKSGNVVGHKSLNDLQ